MTVIYTAANVQQAHLLKNLLDEAGIPATVANEALQGAAGEVPLGWATSARVMVSDDRAAESRRIAEEFDAKLATAARLARSPQPMGSTSAESRQGPTGAEPLTSRDDIADELAAQRRPRCPQCGRPRM
ncbi:MAG TPA: DUF2007 domain-containing protein, partial [Pirellulales bacterium]|nr:DUF2007 domain-containing protein [Pirellulales bacterium]